MNPIGKIKDVVVETLKVPAAVAGSAVGSAVGLARSAATSLVGGGQAPEAPPVPTDVEPEPATAEPGEGDATEGGTTEDGTTEDGPHLDIDPDEPVNVTEELGLDPAPVAKPKPRKKAVPKPVTSIDAEADPSDVDVTPADIAERAGENGPA